MYLYKTAYLGWFFFGSQIQPDVSSVEGEIKAAYGERLRLMSRTDTGVSARGNILVSPKQLLLGLLNSNLKGVRLWAEAEVETVPKVKERHYRYYMVDGKDPSPLMKFNGRHDFSKFTKSKENTIRDLRVEVGEKFGITYVDFYSKGFLWNQVRRLIGTLYQKTAPPLPLVLLDIKFENEPLWHEKTQWLKVFEKQFLKTQSKASVLKSLF